LASRPLENGFATVLNHKEYVMSRKPGFSGPMGNRGPSNTPSQVKTSPARNTPIPRPEPVKRQVTHEMIAKRAYEIYTSGQGGSEHDNWIRAERELRG
jgi:hypothetical protein